MASSVLAVNDDLPVRTNSPVHSGKVRSVYWLTPEDSARLIKDRWYVCASLLLPLLLSVFLFGHIQLSHFIYIFFGGAGFSLKKRCTSILCCGRTDTAVLFC